MAGSISAKTKIVVTPEVKNEAGQVTTAAVLEDKSVTVNYDMPQDLKGLIAKFGEEVVAGQAEAALVISLQAFMRRHAAKPQAELQAQVDGWKPETRATTVRKSAEEKINDLVGGLDAEARKALIAKLKAAA